MPGDGGGGKADGKFTSSRVALYAFAHNRCAANKVVSVGKGEDDTLVQRDVLAPLGLEDALCTKNGIKNAGSNHMLLGLANCSRTNTHNAVYNTATVYTRMKETESERSVGCGVSPAPRRTLWW